MSKKYNFKQFNFKTLNDGELVINCYVYEYATGWGHKCSFWSDTIDYAEKRHTYYNRTWERFEFETLIQEVIQAIYPGKKRKLEREFLFKQVEAIAQRESEKAQAWINGFTKLWNSCKPETREKIQKMDLFINTQEQADATIQTIKALDLLA